MESRVPDYIHLLCQHPRGLSIQAIADRLGVRRQSVYRLRDKAQALGVWVLTHKDDPSVPRGWMRLEDPEAIEFIFRLTRDEADALRTAVARLEPLTPLARRALEKLTRGQLPSPSPQFPSILYSPLADEYPPGLYERVTRAIRERRVTEITYTNAKGQTKTYRFDPYALIARDPHLYLVGANHNSRAAGHDPIKELRMDQIQTLILLRERFPDPGFDVAAYCRARFRVFSGEGDPVRVRVRFSPEKAQYIRRTRRHPTQRVQDQPDGSVIWQVEVPLSEDLVHWITSYGPHAQVLEPETLRQRVVAWARGAVEKNAAQRPSPEGVTTGE